MNWRQNSDITTAPLEPATPSGPPGPQRVSRGRTAVLAVVFVALVAGIVGLVVTRGSGRDDTPPQGATGSIPTTAATVQPEQPPRLVNTGEDWDSIVRSMLAFREWLQLHPRPELLDEIMVPTHPSYSGDKLGLTNFATKGWHYDPVPPPVTVERVSLTTRLSPTKVGLAVRLGPAPRYRVVDQAGNVIADTPATSSGNTVVWTLTQNAGDPRWRLEAVLPL